MTAFPLNARHSFKIPLAFDVAALRLGGSVTNEGKKRETLQKIIIRLTTSVNRVTYSLDDECDFVHSDCMLCRYHSLKSNGQCAPCLQRDKTILMSTNVKIIAKQRQTHRPHRSF